MASAILIGVASGALMVRYAVDFEADRPLYEGILALAGMFVGMYLAMLFHIIVHEAGHLVFGLLTGYRFSSFRIYSFLWLREEGKIRLKRLSIAGTGGQCLMSPPDLKDGKIPFVLYHLGGAISNILVGSAFLIGYFLCLNVPFLSTLFLLFAIVGFVIALTNGIPMQVGMLDNDGYNALSLSRSEDAMKAFWVQLKVSEATSKGILLRDMPAEWFTVPSDEAMKNSMVATGGVFACNRLMDEERFEEADALMAHLLALDSGMVGLYRGMLICDRMYVELIGKHRRDVVERMLTKEQKKFMIAMKRFPSVLRTEYALALLFEKDTGKAEKIRNEFEKVAKTYPYPHETDSELELIEIARTVHLSETHESISEASE